MTVNLTAIIITSIICLSIVCIFWKSAHMNTKGDKK